MRDQEQIWRQVFYLPPNLCAGLQRGIEEWLCTAHRLTKRFETHKARLQAFRIFGRTYPEILHLAFDKLTASSPVRSYSRTGLLAVICRFSFIRQFLIIKKRISAKDWKRLRAVIDQHAQFGGLIARVSVRVRHVRAETNRIARAEAKTFLCGCDLYLSEKDGDGFLRAG